MRLIDADELIEEINSYQYDTVNSEIRKIERAAKAHICELVEKQPVAYDVNKVMDQLEELREEILSDTAYDNDTVNHYLDYADLIIEVVKSGGIDKA